MDMTILNELCRSWRALAEQKRQSAEDTACSDDASGYRMTGIVDGEVRTLEDCAYQLERVLAIYSPLTR